MYAKGDGGPKDTKKAMALWTAAEKAGDPLVAILVADQLFSNLTGGEHPGREVRLQGRSPRLGYRGRRGVVPAGPEAGSASGRPEARQVRAGHPDKLQDGGEIHTLGGPRL
jgi:hypothetical protein